MDLEIRFFETQTLKTMESIKLNRVLRKITFFICFLITIGQSGFATDIKPLNVGDRVPDIQFHLVDAQTGKDYQTKLSDYKGKLVILDFWASWCRSCLSSFSKMDGLQQSFGEKIKVLMVNSQIFGGKGDALKFMNQQKSKNNWPYKFTMAIDDTLAYQLFPSYSIPHYAWISADGIVLAITSSEELTKENIQKVINGEKIDLTFKKDFFPNMAGFDQLEIDDDLLSFSMLKKGKITDDVLENRPMKRQLVVKKGDEEEPRGILMKNLPLVELYKYALPRQAAPFDWYKSTILLEVKDPAKFAYNFRDDVWYIPALNHINYEVDITAPEENVYNYELVVDPTDMDNIPSYLLRDLNKNSGYNGRIEKRTVKCLVLEKFKTFDTSQVNIDPSAHVVLDLRDKKNIFIKDGHPEAIIDALNRLCIFSMPVIDNSHWGADTHGVNYVRFDFTISTEHPPTVDDLNKSLEKYGLRFQEKQMEVDMLVISDR